MGTSLPPLYMWAGGKTRLLARYGPIWPDHDGPYVEPFFGGGAVFGWLAAARPGMESVIGDVNAELTGLLTAVRDAPEPFIAAVRRLARSYLAIDDHAARKAWYYARRAAYWRHPTPAQLYVLLRLGFNGIWQTCRDSDGLYGTPAGLLRHRRAAQILDPRLVRAWSRALAGVEIHTGSYADLVLPERPALVYLDPPYRASHTTYGTGFSDADQVAVVHWYRDRVSEGHRVLLANRCVEGDPFFEDLIGDIAEFHYIDVTYTAGRRATTADGYAATQAREFLAVSRR